jgi:outer membrane protein OmpU
MDNFVGQYSAVNYGFLGYSTNAPGSNAVYAQYAFGDFSVAGSYDSADIITGLLPFTAVDASRWDVSAAYSFNNITAALAYGETEVGVGSADLLVLTLGASFGAFSGTLLIGDETTALVATSGNFYGLSGAYDLSAATTIVASFGDGEGTGDRQQIGLGVIHDLGGGVSLRGGIGQSKTAGISRSQADFGVRFNF